MELQDPKIVESLENIFMPYMTKSREDLSQEGNQFVHYTSAESALNIINSKKLWMRSPLCMNDYMEITHGYNQLFRFFNTDESRGKYIDAVDKYEQGFAVSILKGFDELWKQIQNDTYVTSISVHKKSEDQYGRLSMWRAYGDKQAKAALVVNNPPPIADLRLILSPVLYLSYTELEKEIFGIIKAINENIDFLKTLSKEVISSTILVSLLILAVCVKHPGFAEEREWRLVYFPEVMPENEILEKEIRVINGVPQIIYQLSLKDFPELNKVGLNFTDIFDKIIIGPTQYPLALIDSFAAALENAGVNYPIDRIRISDIPLRVR